MIGDRNGSNEYQPYFASSNAHSKNSGVGQM